MRGRDTNETISSAIFSANFPTLVPPNFCTSHFAAGSTEFWCKLGGVDGLDTDGEDSSDVTDEIDGVESGEGSTSAMVDVRFASGVDVCVDTSAGTFKTSRKRAES